MTDTNERMMDEQIFWYQCQERAMAPGIGDGWPEVILAPHTPNARLKRMDGDPAKTINQLRNDLASAETDAENLRYTLAQLRTDLAAANEHAQRAVDQAEAFKDERDTLRTENAALREGLERLSDYDTTTQEGYMLQEIARDTLARLTTQEGGPQ